jgi:hypothetical protein
LNWLYYFATVQDLDPERKKSLYDFSKPLITFIAGLICLFSGRHWAAKLSGQPNDKPQPDAG